MDGLYAEGVVVTDTLVFTEPEVADGTLQFMQLDGHVFTSAGGVLETHKRLTVEYRRDVPYVATSEYVYMALLRSPAETVPLFRYDNCHGNVDTLHRHHFDHEGRPARFEPVEHDLMPYMDDVIRETDWLAAYLVSRPN